MNKFAFAPLDTAPASATDRVFQVLYKAVISLALPPGSKVSEAEIAKQLDVSRQPVRDAFFRLAALGFLAIRPQRPTLITRISEQAVLDAVFTRVALEVECLRVVLTQKDLKCAASLRDLLGQQTAALDFADPGVFHALDEAFHGVLCESAGHAHVWKLIREQKAHMDRVRFLTLSEERRQQVVIEHTEIVEALEARDAEEAEAKLRSHLGGTLALLPAIRSRFPDYFVRVG